MYNDWTPFLSLFLIAGKKQLSVLSWKISVYNLFNNLLTLWKTFWGWTIVNTVFASHVAWTVQDKSSIADKHVIYAKFRIISEHDAIR